MEEQLKTLIILDRTGAVLGVSTTNAKGLGKTTETGLLWHLHPETERLLPYEPEPGSGGIPCRIVDRGRWYEATAECGRPSGPSPGQADESPGGTSPESRSTGGSPGADEVLSKLVEVVRRRRREMPEGSYTRHLFESGIEKIRKKTGEEAIELILASERSEVVHESADLIYHMLVLLEAAEIPFEAVVEELRKRAEG